MVSVKEAIILAGGKAERLGDAANGRPKALVPIAGRPLAAYQVDLLVAAGVERIFVSCAVGFEEDFDEELSGLGAEIVPVPEDRPLGRGGGLRLAASKRPDQGEWGDIFALNGDELIDIDLIAMLRQHKERDAAATIAVAQLKSPFGVVEIVDGDRVVGFHEAPTLDLWVSCGVYVLSGETLDLLPETGDHEDSTFPRLAFAGLMYAFRHEGLWITVNTPKDLRRAEDYFAQQPELTH